MKKFNKAKDRKHQVFKNVLINNHLRLPYLKSPKPAFFHPNTFLKLSRKY